ncbi:transcriptional regulator, partial [Salmonella enterica]
GGHAEPGLGVVMKITNTPQFQKYTLWLMTDKTSPAGWSDSTGFRTTLGKKSTESDHSEKQTG